MATELKMPQMGYDMEEGTVVRWLKDENSPVEKNEPIAEIETDKAVVEFESETSGVLLKIVAPEGSVIPVGQTIAIVGQEGESVNADEQKNDSAQKDEEIVSSPPIDSVISDEETAEETPKNLRLFHQMMY